jgi:hypothetical protein
MCTVLGIKIPFVFFAPYIPFEFLLGIWILIFGIRDQAGRKVESEPAVAPLARV